MKKIFFLLAVMAFAACTTPEYKTLPIDEFEKVIAQPDVIVVDVRTPEEYAEGHIPGAINIDWKAGHFAEQAEVLLDKDKTIALYCIRARRSKFAAKELQKMGYKNIIELQDGLEVWINAGKPLETGVNLTAEEAVKQIYDEVFDAYTTLTLAEIINADFDHKFLSFDYLQLDTIINEIDGRYPGEIGFHDYDHWIQAQDWDNLSYTIDSTKQVSDTKAQVWITISNFNNKKTPLQLSMVKENGVWKIADFITGENSEYEEMQHYIEADNDLGILREKDGNVVEEVIYHR